MKRSIFYSICFTALGIFLAGLVLILGVLYDYFSKTQQSQLRAQLNLAAQAVEREGLPFLEGLSGQDARITWISAGGSVIYDSKSGAAEMGNHLDREEIRQALASGYGESARYSTTLMMRQLYAARLLSDGTVLRISDAHHSPLSLLLNMLQPISIVVLITIVLALILAFELSRRIVQPSNQLHADVLAEDKDLSPLLDCISSPPLRELLQNAKRGKRGELTLPLGGVKYQINASPVVSEGLVTGIALRIFDAP